MTTIGDSFSIVAILMGIGFTTWALILAASLLFNGRAHAAKERYESHPWAGFGIGLVMTLTVGLLSLVLAQVPVPLFKIMGTSGLMLLLAISSLGSAGLCQLIAVRIRNLEPTLSPYAALTRAAMLIVVAGFFPILGWFFIGPILFVTSLGIGVQALVARNRPVVEGT